MRNGFLTTALLVMTATVGCSTTKPRPGYDRTGKVTQTTQSKTTTVTTTNGQPVYPTTGAPVSTSMPYSQPIVTQPSGMTPNSGQMPVTVRPDYNNSYNK